MIKQFILVFFILFLSSSGFATTQAPSVRTSQGETFVICNSQNSTGSNVVCDNAGGNAGGVDLVAFVHGYNNLTFFFRESGTAGSTCQVYAIGHYDVNGNAINVLNTPDLALLSNYAMFSTPLSATQAAISLTSSDFNAVFAICTVPAGGFATVEMRGSVKAPLR
tara:strand:- start:5651 stop:6145 length:495 start_codon:yes stop_codon:yes gene_type:complete